MRFSSRFLAILGAFVIAPSSQAAILGLEPVTLNDETNSNVAIGQIGFDFLDLGLNLITDLAQFQIIVSNGGSNDSSVTKIFFDTDIIASVDAMESLDPGVSFGFTNMKVLPGGNQFGFTPTQGLSLKANAPVRPNGIDQGESLMLTLSLMQGFSWLNLVDAIENGSTRIGIHVQGFSDGGSETFINEQGILIPAPGLLTMLPATGLLALRRRR